MSLLAATALRIGAKEALCPSAAVNGVAGAAFPTMAGRHVYDSRSIPIDAVRRAKAPVPTLSIYTETVRGVPRGPSQAAAPSEFTVELVIEGELAVYVPKAGTEGEYLGWATSDAAGEMQVDFLLSSARLAILDAVASGVLRGVVKRIASFESLPVRDFVSGARVNRRTLRISCEVGDDLWPAAGGLPEPLATLRRNLADDAYAVPQLDRIAEAIVARPAPVPLEEIRMTLAAVDGVPAEEPEAAGIAVSAAFGDAATEDEENP